MGIREMLEEKEESLHPKAARSRHSSKQRTERKSPVRTEYQRDRDRILHSKSFRRLKHKTQVFISPEQDHFRTRLTHTLEVSQIARTIARALNLNEDLSEAIALGHDLGHTPFGHTGEKVVGELLSEGFRHNEQSLRTVDKLEYDGKGLNLTDDVRDGILKHSKGLGPLLPPGMDDLPLTLEAQIVRIADTIAYVNHDLDDAIRAGLITGRDIPAAARERLGNTFAKRIDTIVVDVIQESNRTDLDRIAMSADIAEEIERLRQFLLSRVYWREETRDEREKIRNIILTLYGHLRDHGGELISPYPEEDSLQRRIVDFIAGMTDRYALNLFRKITFPAYI
jgi:dGTPase